MSDGVKDSSGCEMGSSWGVLIAFKRGASTGSEVEVLLLLLLLPDPLNQPLNKLELSAEQEAEEKTFGGEDTRVAWYAGHKGRKMMGQPAFNRATFA